MKHKNIKTIPQTLNKRGILAQNILDASHATIKCLSVEENDAIPKHDVNVHVTFIVLSGHGTISIGDECFDVKAEDVVLCPPNTPMSIQAKTLLRFLNIKTPGMASS